MNRRPLLCVALLLGLAPQACGHPNEAPLTAASTASAATPQAPAAPTTKDGEARFSEGARAFQAAREALMKKFYRADLTEDELYQAAVRGMLEHVDARLGRFQELLSPGQLAALQSDLEGAVVGIGIELKFDDATGAADVTYALPGAPAERAGVLAGDRILNVNGKRFQGRAFVDMVNEIRGRVGESVSLLLLRGDGLITKQIVRERVPYDNVSGLLLPEGVGYVSIGSFTAGTPAALKAAIQRLQGQRARALVLDLRGNHGGLLDKALACAELLLPRGAVITRMVRRGGAEEVLTAKSGPVLTSLPVVVLVNGETSSGAELLAAALQSNLRAQLVGQKTFGKWNVQTIEELPNGFACKFTISQFRAPGGQSYDGQGLTPDVEVSMDDKLLGRLSRVTDPDKRLAADIALRTAANLARVQAR